MRTQRKLTEQQKQVISQAMKKFHAGRTETQKAKTAERQSQSMKDYWATIPDGADLSSPIRTPVKTSTAVIQPLKPKK